MINVLLFFITENCCSVFWNLSTSILNTQFYVECNTSFSPFDSSIVVRVGECSLAKPCGQLNAVFLLSHEFICIWI